MMNDLYDDEHVEYPKCPFCGESVYVSGHIGSKKLTFYCDNGKCPIYGVKMTREQWATRPIEDELLKMYWDKEIEFNRFKGTIQTKTELNIGYLNKLERALREAQAEYTRQRNF